ncbi:MAG TPA: histidine kinase [Terriglobia bacterium]|nr:histidine kinase [Terriglobia bacterium]
MIEPGSLSRRGTLKIYLGYAAGVGKTYKMLDEAQELRREGVDVVIGYFEAHGRKDTIAKAEGLETVPRRRIVYKGAIFEEMDAQAIVDRRPKVCLVDEFAHTNVPGSERTKRWEDVQLLLDAGIDVITTMNVQHLESLNDQVWQITGVRVRETIPDWVIKQADEVVMVDLPPEALLNRLKRGAVYALDKASQAMQNFFKESTLVVLRELALRQTAHEVDVRQSMPEALEATLPTAGAVDAGPAARSSHASDRILIYVTSDPLTAMLIRRGKRVADYLHADCFAVSIHHDLTLHDIPAEEREALEKHLNFARSLHIETRMLQGDDVAATLVEFARMHQITQIFLARPQRRPALGVFGKGLVQQVVRQAHDMHVTIVAERHRDNVPS